ncbi:MAG: winged helix-turn-helix domain-containing protein, partial [Caldilineaceae bacterium]|nr:winged helix-turn-helix domain-containing protein [Caldilineaceae bacterium]
LWPDAAGGVNEAMLDNTVARLRRRLRETDTGAEMIETVRGMGYRLRG